MNSSIYTITNQTKLWNGQAFYIPQPSPISFRSITDIDKYLMDPLVDHWVGEQITLHDTKGKEKKITTEQGIVDKLLYEKEQNYVCIKLEHEGHYHRIMDVIPKRNMLYVMKRLKIQPISIKDIELVI